MQKNSQDFGRRASCYYDRHDSGVATLNEFSPAYALKSTETPKRRLSIFRSNPAPLPEPTGFVLFHIYRTSPILSRKVYDIRHADKRTSAFHVTFPHTAFGLTSRPNILIQRDDSNGPVIGEVRFHSMHPDEIVLPAFGPGSTPETTKVTSERFFNSRKRVHFGGKDYFWRHTSSKSDSGSGDGSTKESAVSGRWKCVDDKGAVFALVNRTASTKKIGKIAVVQAGLSDQEIEALVVTALAMLEKEERRGSDSGTGEDRPSLSHASNRE